MMAPRRDTVARALKLVGTGGKDGLSVAAFAARWPTRKAKKDGPRKATGPIGQFLSYLATEGLLTRDILGQYTVTGAGLAVLQVFEAEVARSREGRP